MFIVKKDKNELYSLPAKQISIENIGSISSELAQRIVGLLADCSMPPIEIARALKEHEQKIYYHIRNLEKAGIIQIVKRGSKKGAITNYYSITEPAFVVALKKFETTNRIAQIKSESKFLEPFIKEGILDALIIVGSPDPHGPEKARSRDGYYGMDLALFFGTFLNYVPKFNVKLDTETREKDFGNNLILIGGPIVNKVTAKVNEHLPIRFESGTIKSAVSNEQYPEEECGIIAKAKNPFSKDKFVLVVAGNRSAGTRAAIIAFLKNFKKIAEGNIHDPKISAKVVEGVDLDSDGIIDNIEFRE